MNTYDLRKGKGSEQGQPDVERQILDAVKSLRFGSVEVTVHEGRVVQIDRRERTRLVDKKR
jgi:hypothetical protein